MTVKQLLDSLLEMGQAGLEEGPGAADEPFNRFGRNAEDLGNLGVAQSFIMPEDHGGLLVGRKGVERQMDLVLALFFDEAFILAERWVNRLRNVVYAGELSLTGAVNAKVGQSAVEIGSKSRRRTITWGGLQNLEKGLLGNVLGFHRIAKKPVRHPPGKALIS